MRRKLFPIYLCLLFSASLAFPQNASTLWKAVTSSREYQQYIAKISEAGKYCREEETGLKELVPGGKKMFAQTIIDATKYLDEVIETFEEFAGYFSFWNANLYAQTGDKDKARQILGEIAKKYQEAKVGKIAKTILREAKNDEQLLTSIKKEFEALPNPMEMTAEERKLPSDSLRNKVREFFRGKETFKEWQSYNQMLIQAKSKPGILEIFKKAGIRAKIDKLVEGLLKPLDEELARRFVEKGGNLSVAKLVPELPKKEQYLEQSLSCYKEVAERYPDTSAAKFARTVIEEKQK